jgi:hypothetical protein
MPRLPFPPGALRAQFDEQVRQEAAQMAEHYEIFYCLESTIRTLINDTLAAAQGPKWWDSARVPPLIQGGGDKASSTRGGLWRHTQVGRSDGLHNLW